MEKFSLVGVDGNAFSIMGYVEQAMKKTGYSKEEREVYRKEAMSGDYNHLVCMSLDQIDECNERL